MTNRILKSFVLIFALLFAPVVSAQEAEQQQETPTQQDGKTETTNQDKKSSADQKKITQFSKKIARDLKPVQLTEDQDKALAKLIAAQLGSLKELRNQSDSVIKKDDRKKVNDEIKKARNEGKSLSEASKIGWKNGGLSEEDQVKLLAISEKKDALFAKIQTDLVKTFSEDQKKAWDAIKEKEAKKKSK